MSIKQISAAIASIVMMFSFAMLPIANATTNETSLINSGDDAHISTSTNTNTSVNVENKNSAYFYQKANLQSNTGGNSASGNISLDWPGATINTGPASVDATLDVKANSNTTLIELGGNTSDNLTDVVNTGDNAHVDTSLNNNSHVYVKNYNKASVSQKLNAKANTGFNNADDNIGGASIFTGPAEITAALDVKVNKNATVVAAGNGEDGDASNTSLVTNTGDDAHINTSSNSNSSVDVYNKNYAYIKQKVYAKANTGHNSASDNIGDALIDTGLALGDLHMGVAANENKTGVGGLSWLGSSNLNDVVNTGDNAHSNTDVNNNSHVYIKNSNKLKEKSYTYVKTNTGKNFADDNIGEADVSTHVAWMTPHVVSHANANGTIVGNLGSWLDLLFD